MRKDHRRAGKSESGCGSHDPDPQEYALERATPEVPPCAGVPVPANPYPGHFPIAVITSRPEPQSVHCRHPFQQEIRDQDIPVSDNVLMKPRKAGVFCWVWDPLKFCHLQSIQEWPSTERSQTPKPEAAVDETLTLTTRQPDSINPPKHLFPRETLVLCKQGEFAPFGWLSLGSQRVSDKLHEAQKQIVMSCSKTL